MRNNMSDNSIGKTNDSTPVSGDKKKVIVKGPLSSLVLSYYLIALVAICVGFLGGFAWGYDKGINMPVTIYDVPVEENIS